jgi:hypothetical protein
MSSLRFTSVIATLFVIFLGVALLVRVGDLGVASGPSQALAADTTFLNFFNGQ